MFLWPLVFLIDRLAWPLSYQTYVTAQGGPGWHRGRFGADKVHFIRKVPGAKQFKKLKSYVA